MRLTLGTTYYNNPDYLKRFVEHHLDHVDELIIVDDGSPDTITNYLSPTNKIKLFRVTKDYGFNSHGCRNLIMSKTSNEWNILMDIDREFIYPEIATGAIKRRKLNTNTLYRFIAHFIEKGDGIHHSVNDFLINKKHFFSAGGYDEEIIGERWGDREYFLQLCHYGKEATLYDVDMVLTRHPSFAINTCSPHDKHNYEREGKEIIERRIKTPEPNKPILTFDWEEIK